MYSNAPWRAASAPSFVYLIYIRAVTAERIYIVRVMFRWMFTNTTLSMSRMPPSTKMSAFCQKHWSVTLPSVSIKRQCVMLRASDEMLTPHFVSLRPSASYGIE